MPESIRTMSDSAQEIEVLMWRANQTDLHGDLMTSEALQGLADSLIEKKKGKKISLNWDFTNMIGSVVWTRIEGDDLYVTVEIDAACVRKEMQDGKLTLRPGFEMTSWWKDEQDNCIVDECKKSIISIVPKPLPLPGEQ